MFKKAVLISFTLLGFWQTGWADEAGKSVFEQRCASCHQAKGEGNQGIKAPLIAGLSQKYLSRQLTNFKSGLRGYDPKDTEGQMMKAIVQGLSDDEISAVSSYVSKMPVPEIDQEKKSPGFAGRGSYSGCTSCHGAKAEGFDDLGAPRLAGQHTWYLVAQLEKFRAGLRGGKADDTHGQQMKLMAEAIKDDATVTTIVRYISTLKPE